ncbi:MAG: hypothetical protein UX21_C0027G0006 [Microgenomates group bacterium GW2011_GWC2_45_8]|nr:MAG: hypothetical protein UX21_C0027G0006 [Microgenomates group bacterium GW2011_GWC2_45_8]
MPSSMIKKVLILNFDPIIESADNRRIHEYYEWNDSVMLEQQYIDAIKEISHNQVEYQIAEHIDIDAYPTKTTGYQFTDSSYLTCMQNPSTCNSKMINYQTVIAQYQVCEKLNAGTIDELWLWGGPYFGYYEANMAGPNAFSTNGPIIDGTTCQRQLNIMGFNYERAVGEMLEDLAHRTEGTMAKIYGYTPYSGVANLNNPWGRFTAYNKIASNQSGCGSIHYPPNGINDYDWTNTTTVKSFCEDWNDKYPLMRGYYSSLNCDAWGCSAVGWKKYWFSHLPYSAGTTDGKLNNWWAYLVDYENATAQASTSNLQYFKIKNGIDDKNTSCGSNATASEIYLGMDDTCKPSKPYLATFNFTGVAIPKKSKITGAYMSFTQDGPYNNPLQLSISLSLSPFANSTSSVSWDLTNSWTTLTRDITPDFTAQLQQVIDSPYYQIGKTVVVKVNYVSGTGHRSIFAYERYSPAAPVLVVEYEATTSPSPTAIPSPNSCQTKCLFFPPQFRKFCLKHCPK